MSVYPINKGVDKPVVFRGLKAQWIWWLGIGIAALLLLFTILYICGVPIVICTVLIAVSGSGLFYRVYRLNRLYGEHGMMKKMARRYVPKQIKSYERPF